MASLGMMLAGSAIGQGAANYVHQAQQGDMDRERLGMAQASDAFQQNQMDRIIGQQQIEDNPTTGSTDEDRLNQLADLAGKAGRGDLQRKYQGAALQARQKQDLVGLATASRAITMGNFDQATQVLNKTNAFKGIQSIALADDVQQDPRNPTYSIYTPGPSGEDGNPTPGPHVHLTQQALYGLQANPEHLFQWHNMAMNQAQQNDIRQQRVDQSGDKLDETTRHNMAMEAAKSAAGKNASGRLTNEQWRTQWAQTPKEQGGGGMTPQQAHIWAADPNKNSREYWKAMDLGLKINQSGGMFSVDDIERVVKAVKGSPITGPQEPAAPPVAPPAPAKPNLASMGVNPVQGKPGVFADPKGRHFKQQGDSILQWSPSQSKWVDVTAAISGAR